MRIVVDTNILISALLIRSSLPAELLYHWRDGKFEILTSAEQIDELTRVTRYPKIRARLVPALAGKLINELHDIAVGVGELPVVDICSDPDDNCLLAMASAGAADFLVTGDKRDLLELRLYEGTKIITVREFLTMNRQLP